MENPKEKGLGTLRLTMFGIGLILASGAFAIPGDFAAAGAYPLASLIGWGITRCRNAFPMSLLFSA